MSNPLYEQVKLKVEASPLAQASSGRNPFAWREELYQAERIRSLAVARAFSNLFMNICSAIANLDGAVNRARTANSLSKLEETRLADIGLKRSDLPGYVAGIVQDAKKSISESPSRKYIKKAA